MSKFTQGQRLDTRKDQISEWLQQAAKQRVKAPELAVEDVEDVEEEMRLFWLTVINAVRHLELSYYERLQLNK